MLGFACCLSLAEKKIKKKDKVVKMKREFCSKKDDNDGGWLMMWVVDGVGG